MFFRVVGRLTVRFFTGLGRFLAGMVRSFVRKPLAGLFTLLVFAAIIGSWFYFGGFGLFSSSTVAEGTANDSRNTATTDMMVGLTNLDASKVWGAFSPGYQQQLSKQGVTADSMQKTFEGYKKDLKINYVGYLFQQSTNFNNGTVTDSYIATLKYQESQVAQFNYLLLLDNSGKISSIGTDDPVLSAGIGRKQQQTQQQGQ